MTNNNSEAIKLSNVTISYEQSVIVEDFSCSISHGERVAIMGNSGCGKSSLLAAIVGLTPITSGEIELNGTIVKGGTLDSIRREVAWLPQQVELSIDTTRELFDIHQDLRVNSHRKFETEQITQLLAELGLESDVLDRAWSTLSGGERQRVMVVCAIILERGIMLLDEPTSALDSASTERLAKLLASLEGRTIIAVTHDEEFAKSFDRVIRL